MEGPHAKMESCLLQMGSLSRQREGLCARCQVLALPVLDSSRYLILRIRGEDGIPGRTYTQKPVVHEPANCPRGLVHPICKRQPLIREGSS